MERPRTYDEALESAAALWGIEPQFWDIWGRLHITPAETKTAILKGMGVPTGTLEELAGAIAERTGREQARLVPPCLVISENERPRQFFAQGGDFAGDMAVEIRDEAGGASRLLVPARGKTAVPFDVALPIGYYDVTVTAGARSERMRLILAPDRAYSPEGLRDAGIAVSLYGVRSRRNWGCGDFRDLRDLVDWAAAETGAGFIGLNPLHAIHNRRPYNTSPYLPNSIFYQNLIYLDVEGIEDFQTSRRAQRLWNDGETRKRVAGLRAAEFVEYEDVHALKLTFLKLAFLEFRAKSPRCEEFEQFVSREGDLLDRFATCTALDEYLHRRNPDLWIWPDWPEPFCDPASAEVAAFRRKHWRSVLFYKYAQWQIDRQLAAAQEYARSKLSIGLYQDVALATDRCGADLWAHRNFFIEGCRVGSPPDDFAPEGQDWAFPPPNSGQHYETGYRLFADSIRNNCRHAGALRIDHVMRFFRLYWIPEGTDAAHGAYVRDRHEDLIRILALESVRRKVVVVGEDLGTVEPAVRETLERFGILSYRLFYFERGEGGAFRSPEEYPRGALVSTTTHDLPTLAGFWISEDIHLRRRLGLLDESGYRDQLAGRARDKQSMLDLLRRLGLLPPGFPESSDGVPELTGELHNAVIGFLASTRSALMLVNQEDLTKEIAQQNLPGTTWQYPNWRRKMTYSVEELSTEKAARDFSAMFRHWLMRSGRIQDAATRSLPGTP